jgi:glycosyltransferase involved in cell wall biosynthesis
MHVSGSTAAPIRLLQFLTIFAVGGTERQVVNLTLGLNRERFDVSFGCHRRVGQFLKTIEDRGIPIETYSLSRFASLHGAWQGLRLLRHIARKRIAIVHTYGFYGNVFALPAARLAGAPVLIASIRDDGVCLTPRQRAVQRVVCRLADTIVTNAEGIKKALVAEGWAPDRITVIPNGVDTERFAVPVPHSPLRAELGIPDGVPIVAMTARLTRFKGAHFFIEAAARLRAKHPDVRFVIVGPGETPRGNASASADPYVAGLGQQVQALGLQDRLIFAGCRTDIPAVLQDVAVAVQPSISEGMSNAVLEAMAAGRPVVATDVGGMSDVVIDGTTGLLVPPADVEALAGAIDRLLGDPALGARLGAEARRVVFDQFSIAQMIERTERLYVDLLTRKASRRQWRRAEPHGARIPKSTGAELP